MRRMVTGLAGLAVLCLGAASVLTMTHPRDMGPFSGLTGDKVHGEQVFWASGCASCHMAPKAEGDAQLVLAGGQAFATQFGTFHAPNISPDPDQGIGGWDIATFVHSIQDGISPEGEHVYPAMPFSAYSHMVPQDVVDLKAFLDGLPPSATASVDHDLAFPYNIRRTLGIWKLLFAKQDWVMPDSVATSPQLQRGRYIVEAMAHCGECHTPRNALGGLNRAAWLSGAPLPDGPGRVPNITPAKLTWSDTDIAAYLSTGFTPDFDVVGGSMAHVVANMGKLPETDVAAIVAYLKATPAVP
ncbi:MAG: cytochrome c [Alphaproteobacteria bacterium]